MIWLVLALSVKTATSATTPPAAVDLQRMSDLGYAVQSMERLAVRAAALPAAERRAHAAAAADLATNSPYSRATFMLVLTVERELGSIDPSGLSADERARFALLARGVEAHADLLRSIGADELPAPIPGDHLFGSFLVRPKTLPDGLAFAASGDPIAETQRVFALVPEMTAMPGWIDLQMREDQRVLSELVDGEETLPAALARWAEEVEALAPSLGSDRVGRLSALLEAYSGRGC